jgi:hypothetical protein
VTHNSEFSELKKLPVIFMTSPSMTNFVSFMTCFSVHRHEAMLMFHVTA